MDFFEEYVRELELNAAAALAGNDCLLENVDFTKLLNGEVGSELRRRVSLEYRQRIGAFLLEKPSVTMLFPQSLTRT
jgi:hypothetical protein